MGTALTTAQVRLERDGDIAVIVIDNPPINAGSAAVRSGLLAAIDTVAQDGVLQAAVIIGAGTTFIAGSDLKEFGQPLQDPQLPAIIAAIERCGKPVVAALHGAALGGGYELALGCDYRIAAPGTVVGLPEVTLGTVFHIEGLTFKNHIGCGHVFPSIDGVLALREQYGLRPDDIASVSVGTYQAALDIACYGVPASANEARFSMPFMLATALVHGSVRMRAYEAAGLADPGVHALMPRIATAVDAELDARFPAQRAARIEIVRRDGLRLAHFQPNRKGDPEDPLDDADLGNKLLELATPVIGGARAAALLARLWQADGAGALDW